MRVLFLDDDPERHAEFMELRPDAVRVWTADEAMAALASERFDLVYLDRDLYDHGALERGIYLARGQRDSGETVATFIASQPADARPARVIVHSWNDDGAARMVATLKTAGVPVEREIFSVRPRSPTAAEIAEWSKPRGR